MLPGPRTDPDNRKAARVIVAQSPRMSAECHIFAGLVGNS
jgi:hypothetical protein